MRARPFGYIAFYTATSMTSEVGGGSILVGFRARRAAGRSALFSHGYSYGLAYRS